MRTIDRTTDEDLSALVDGELPPERAARLRERVDADPTLAARLAELEGVDAALRALPAPVPSSGLRASVLSASRSAADDGASRGPRRIVPAAGGALLALAASLAVYLVTAGPAPGPAPAPLGEAFAQATVEEIGIVLEYETLADLEVIEDLELLERMIALEGGGPS